MVYNQYMYEFIRKTAEENGFSEVFFTKAEKIENWRKQADAAGLFNVKLFDDVENAYPYAKSLVLMMYPYEAFEIETRISAYYLASNKAYHASKKIIDAIKEKGYSAENAKIPLRAMFLKNGIGVLSKNGLLRYSDYGSRIILCAIATDAVCPRAFEIKETKPCEKDCCICIKSCPVQAIGNIGLEQRKCMRYYMDDIPYPESVLKNIQHYMGCEICMYVCKENADLKKRKPTEKEVAAFDAVKLLTGEDKEARELVGKNFTRHKKLSYEAENFIKRQENKGK